MMSGDWRMSDSPAAVYQLATTRRHASNASLMLAYCWFTGETQRINGISAPLVPRPSPLSRPTTLAVIHKVDDLLHFGMHRCQFGNAFELFLQ